MKQIFMERTLVLPDQIDQKLPCIMNNGNDRVKGKQIKAIEKFIVQTARRMNLIYYAFVVIKKRSLAVKVLKQLIQMLTQTWGGTKNKTYRVNNKYYYNLYIPGWPSALYNGFVKDELRRNAFSPDCIGNQSMVFLAVTTKCPLRCEHGFEWNNLNKRETFTREELKELVDMYQRQGAKQFYFTGGEPMVRLHDLVDVIHYAKQKSECFVLTSGFNLTHANVALLKNAGCTGIVVSLDHYILELHNSFRQSNIFDQAILGVKASLQSGLLTVLSVCTTKEFIDGGHLMPYMEFAKELGVHFVQLLEPKSIGHYENKDVLLEHKHVKQLENFFLTINQDKKYKDYPCIMYHGFHQRRAGCYSASHSIYIDSAGFANTCPFCHTKSYNVRDVLNTKEKTAPVKQQLCPAFGKIA
jgi:MoaA/NifB/PqqE/SkfB family radical SAM enzyme